MSYRYLIDTERKLVTTVFIGRTSAEESITAMSEILKDPAYLPGMNAVTEYSDASATGRWPIWIGSDGLSARLKRRSANATGQW